MGRFLEVNLSNSKIETKSIKEEAQRRFLGGSGLAAKIFFDSFDSQVDPLSPGKIPSSS